MYDTLLVPVDGSDASDAAADHALELAEAFDSDLHFVFAVEVDPGSVARGIGGIDPTVAESLREEGEEVIAAHRETAMEREISCEHTIETGAPDEVIADAAGADAVVMGTHARTGLERELLGSTAERTLRSVDLPVLAVPPQE
jgi:nucleotide-binding universal stress UspA family protein